MKSDIFIKSYRNDFKWLKYLLRSIQKHAKGFNEVHIVIPSQDEEELSKLNLTREKIHLVNEDPKGDGYLSQQLFKIYADQYTKAETIFFFDSDCCLNRDIKPDEFFIDGKPYMLITPYTELPPEVPWRSITEKALKFPCPFETMRRLPYVYPSKLLPRFREYMYGQHHIPVEKYIMEQPFRKFSEFNAIGSWAHRYSHDDFFWWDTSKTQNLPQTCLIQNWSWGGITPDIQKHLEETTA